MARRSRPRALNGSVATVVAALAASNVFAAWYLRRSLSVVDEAGPGSRSDDRGAHRKVLPLQLFGVAGGRSILDGLIRRRMGVNDQSDPSGQVKVIDRRWFTADGSLRNEREMQTSPTSTQAPTSTQVPISTQVPGQDEKAAESRPGRDADPSRGSRQVPASSPVFLELLALLAQQAQMLLAGRPGTPRQPEQAQRLIEYLAALEHKTRGNLSAEEAQTLSSVLFELRSFAGGSLR